ncbi:LysR family transcriptional regulator [Marinimicrobium sp. ABcell2]|uniref:LysR family transcriptional regulator n=1 Tax=Marinimicrobium sp. ABcell2 TaxID=3069751 RepID=UPI0027B4D7B5|nr:LysR family transcriptional regulator [Marinimicrobium sp. ABcell2]MDQ2077981.1 LysR family transcriptional regulator [Marinimicrobium sp. ABcell2]
MDIGNLQLLIQVVETGSFTGAARRLGADPSQVSRSIAGLERELGIRLFHRSTRKIALTTAGAAYVERLSPLLEELQLAGEAAREQQSQPTGRLTFTASTAFGQTCVLPYMAEFQERYPEIQLDLRFTDAVLDIISEQIDLACRLTSSADPNLVGKKLFPTCFWVCASPAYLQKAGTPQHPQDLADHKVLAMNLPGYRERWLFQSTKNDSVCKVPLHPAVLVSNALALREAALQGLGITLLASWLAEGPLRSGELVSLFPGYRCTASDFQSAAWLLYPSRLYIPAKTRAMVDFLYEVHSKREKPVI